MKQNSAGPRRDGPEAQLVRHALTLGLIARFGEVHSIRHFHEPAMAVGLPDLVIARARANWAPPRKRAKLGDRHLRLLHQVHRMRFTSAAALAELTCYSMPQVERILGDLVDAGVVVATTHGVRARALGALFALTRIVAIEAKMTDWRGAVEQATRNTWFASDSYIMLPEQRCTRAACDHASERGVGVLAVGDDAVRTLVRPRKFPLPSSYGSWQVNEWAHEALSAEVA